MHGPQGNEKELQDLRLAKFMELCSLKIIILGGKGGVGKSTVSVNLAAALAGLGYRVGLLDADLHGPNTARMLGVEGSRLEPGSEQGLITPYQARPSLRVASLAMTNDESTPFIWRGPLKIAIIRQFLADVEWGPLDILVADSPPGTGDEPLTLAQSITGKRFAVVVTTGQDVALQDASRSLNFAKSLELPILGIVENMAAYLASDGSELPLFGGPGAGLLAKSFGVPILARLPLDPEVSRSPDMPFTERDGILKTTFAPVVDAVIKALKGGGTPMWEPKPGRPNAR